MSSEKEQSVHPTAVYIESGAEQEAWLISTFGPEDAWQMVSQSWEIGPSGERQEVLEIAPSSGENVRVAFQEAAIDDSLEGEGTDRTGLMDDLMEKALAYGTENPPHHPGSLPRFPVPSPSYRSAIAVPLAVLAVDDSGTRGLYAPPRQVAMDRESGDLVGVGEYPDFDPEKWPPAHLGPWPPSQLLGVPAIQLQAMIARFSACWSRVMDAWFKGVVDPDDVLRADVKEALHRRSVLDLMEMRPYYERLNPVFAKWLNDMVGQDTQAEET